MKGEDLESLLDRAIKRSGRSRVQDALKGLASETWEAAPDLGVLTIVANAGVHTIPQSFLRGEVYEASRGDWDVSTQDALRLELRGILSSLVNKLRSRRWNRVYLIPTGHPILSMQIKSMVYRVLRLNTVDLYYKNGSYFEVDLDQRSIAIDQSKSK